MYLAQAQPTLNQQPTNFQMTTPLWIGFGFLAALVVFLIISFFVIPSQTNDQRRTIKFLTALCAGFAGGFLTGGSIFEAHWTGPSAAIGISGTAGFAIFFAVFFTYNKIFSKKELNVDNGLRVDLPVGWTFEQVVDTISGKDGAGSSYEGFTDAEKNTEIRNQALTGESYKELIEAVGSLARNGSIRPYSVSKTGSLYKLKVS